jgi:hypothetical protein
LKNWVGNKLTGTVIRDIAAPIGCYEFGPNIEWVDEDMIGVGVAPQGKGVWVLKQQQAINTSFGKLCVQAPL